MTTALKANDIKDLVDNHELVKAISLIDPILQFWIRKTGLLLVPLTTLQKTIPSSKFDKDWLRNSVQQLANVGLLQVQVANETLEETAGDCTDTVNVHKPKIDDDIYSVQLSYNCSEKNETQNKTAKSTISVGFVAPRLADEDDNNNNSPESKKRQKFVENISGSTKTAAKRRLAALKRILKEQLKNGNNATNNNTSEETIKNTVENIADKQDCAQALLQMSNSDDCSNVNSPVQKCDADIERGKEAREAIERLLGIDTLSLELQQALDIKSQPFDTRPAHILPQQISYAGSTLSQQSIYKTLPTEILLQFCPDLYRFCTKQQLYSHQAVAIEAAMSNQHVSVGTGTGSGKSMCFLIPVMHAACSGNATSIIIFPTKALAQDQLTKIQELLLHYPDLATRIRPATLDGDTPYSQRQAIAAEANILLTNPDTLHASILPNWQKEKAYTTMLSRLQYIVLDESHVYMGVFGAHVALVLKRLLRVITVAKARSEDVGDTITLPTFIACSATLPWPESHMRQLCPLLPNDSVVVLTNEDDGSPRSAKHFWVWNPPLLNIDGTTTGSCCSTSVENQSTGNNLAKTTRKSVYKKRKRATVAENTADSNNRFSKLNPPTPSFINDADDTLAFEGNYNSSNRWSQHKLMRRHAADETAMLLAQAVCNGVRCIAFCKTRNVVEWVYERTRGILKKEERTAHLADKVESYRGGYRMEERRKIEKRLFCDEVLGVVGTNALELGIDLGGIDLTLHCGYPSSYASLLQQAGRAGRGKSRLEMASCAVIVCFNSPSEQHIWRNPTSLLAKGVQAPHTIPITGSTLQGHLLCACDEFPLCGSVPLTNVVGHCQVASGQAFTDKSLFADELTYLDSLETLLSTRSALVETVGVPSGKLQSLEVVKAHPSAKDAWKRVNIRSIEPVSYAIVDTSHANQSGKTDRIYDESAIMDTLPYSRVFYHAHPGAIITHRGRRYKVISMTSPPAFSPDNYSYCRSMSLAAFAKPTTARYVTRALSTMHITVVRQFERVNEFVKGRNGTCDSPALANSESKDEAGRTLADEKDENDATLVDSEDKQHNEISVKETSDKSKATAADNANEEKSGTANIDEDGFSMSLAGCGIVNVRRTVSGYKKLSLVNRTEIGRSELKLPDMEYESFGVWIDADAEQLQEHMGDDFGLGIHALSHALLAVAPIVANGLVRSDLECDHSFHDTSRVCLIDQRAGGSGATRQLWKLFFRPVESNANILVAALDLLQNCDTCSRDKNYDGGCPACLHASNCLKFNVNMSRRAAIIVAKHMLDRVKQTEMYKAACQAMKDQLTEPIASTDADRMNVTPRRSARKREMNAAQEMRSSSRRQFVVGKPSWPMDGDESKGRQIFA